MNKNPKNAAASPVVAPDPSEEHRAVWNNLDPYLPINQPDGVGCDSARHAAADGRSHRDVLKEIEAIKATNYAYFVGHFRLADDLDVWDLEPGERMMPDEFDTRECSGHEPGYLMTLEASILMTLGRPTELCTAEQLRFKRRMVNPLVTFFKLSAEDRGTAKRSIYDKLDRLAEKVWEAEEDLLAEGVAKVQQADNGADSRDEDTDAAKASVIKAARRLN